MAKIAIISDSTSDLTLETIEKYNIRILPLRVIYTDGEYRDRVDITPEEIYSRFKEEIPTTSLPSPQDTTELFNKLKQEGYTHVIVVTISSGISGTMNMIRNIADSYEGLSFEIIDSKSLTMGAGFAIIEGAKELEKAHDFEKAVNRIKEVLKKTKVYYVVQTLEYLKKGGRIGKVEGTIGELLNIKPIISINEDGVYYSYKKIRGRSRSIEELFEIIKEKAKETLVNIAVAHGDAFEESQELFKKVKGLKNIKEAVFTQISPVLVVHTGPGLIGIVVSEA
ncbi:MAG: fatty acid-binding protein DegV [Clostridia bacterium BRH_c25]|nr:MAG: fatty acid-binding protein DegV [Clostridia bacterium BRH_c25]